MGPYEGSLLCYALQCFSEAPIMYRHIFLLFLVPLRFKGGLQGRLKLQEFLHKKGSSAGFKGGTLLSDKKLPYLKLTALIILHQLYT